MGLNFTIDLISLIFTVLDEYFRFYSRLKNTVYWNKWQRRIWFRYLSTGVICYHSVVFILNQYTQISLLLPSGRPWVFNNLRVAVPGYTDTTRFPAEHLPSETCQWNNGWRSSELKKSAPRSVGFRFLQSISWPNKKHAIFSI